MDSVEWVTTEQIKKRFGVEDFEIFDAIEKGLKAYNIKKKEVPKQWIAVDRDQARQWNEQSRIRMEQKSKRSGLPPIFLGGNFLALCDCIFKEDGVFNLWDEKPENFKSLSANALLKQPVFKKAMEAMADVLLYCEENKPAKRDKAMDIVTGDHKLPENVYREIWRVIPDSMKRAAGDRDR